MKPTSCEVPGCTTSGPPSELCTAWNHRLCFEHFADFWAWSEHRVRDRAPSWAEWVQFLDWMRSERSAA